jgi:hypothetical protein
MVLLANVGVLGLPYRCITMNVHIFEVHTNSFV